MYILQVFFYSVIFSFLWQRLTRMVLKMLKCIVKTGLKLPFLNRNYYCLAWMNKKKKAMAHRWIYSIFNFLKSSVYHQADLMIRYDQCLCYYLIDFFLLKYCKWKQTSYRQMCEMTVYLLLILYIIYNYNINDICLLNHREIVTVFNDIKFRCSRIKRALWR
jgi:hypothetical protein